MTESEFPRRPTAAFISLENLAFNLNSVRRFLGGSVDVLSVVKADAYGHGAVECARRLEAEGTTWFAVALLEEALELRRAGIKARILCFGSVWPRQASVMLTHAVTPVIFDLDAAEMVDSAAATSGIRADIHVKIDTGMNRVGVPAAVASDFASRLTGFKNLNVEGLLTHFAAADDLDECTFTNSQVARFDEAVQIFRTFGHRPSVLDLANSPGAVVHSNSRRSLVRIGGLLYGLGGDVLPKGVPAPELKPVMALASKLALVKTIPTGSSIGYGRSWVAKSDSIIGTVPIGYHDGYCRPLSNIASVIVNGSLTPVVGRISMDWITIDLSAVPHAKVGDKVTLIGSDGPHSVRAEQLAEMAGTISYEITCGISARVPRIYSGV